MLIQNIYCENTRLEEESVKPLEIVYCYSTPQRSHTTPGSSSQGDTVQSVGAGISRGSCWQSAPNFPVSSVNGLFTALTNARSCINPFSTNPTPSLDQLPPESPDSTGRSAHRPAVTGTRPGLAAASPGDGWLVSRLLPGRS